MGGAGGLPAEIFVNSASTLLRYWFDTASTLRRNRQFTPIYRPGIFEVKTPGPVCKLMVCLSPEGNKSVVQA